MTENSTFFGAHGDFASANATVGENGSFAPEGMPRSNMDYSIGYSSAALSLIDLALKSDEVLNSVDYLVYPICFNMRHAIELQLKEFWGSLEKLSQYRKVALEEHRTIKIKATPSLKKSLHAFPDVKESTTHDIGIFWDLIGEYAPIIDRRFLDVILLVSEIISDIAEIDPTGQTFRYPSDTISKVHLVDTPLISIHALKIRFTFLRKVMHFLDDLIREVKYEYSWCNITAHLSYFDIISAAYDMQPFIGKAEPYYKLAKKEIINKYKLSSNEYSKLIKLIDCNYCINGIIQIDNKPIHLDINDLILFFDVLNKLNPFEEYLARINQRGNNHTKYSLRGSYGEDHFDAIKRKRTVIQDFLDALSPEKLAEICSLYDFHKEPSYFEMYKDILREKSLYFNKVYGDKKAFHTEIKYYFDKNNFFEGVIFSLWRLNIKSIFQEIIDRYNLSGFHWYEKLINGERHNSLSFYEWYNIKMNALADELKRNERIIYLLRRGD
ncbi:TPA: hypothetical protein LVL98_006121 [Klebsiella michiganensis]|uniref:hypothetical protein n=1 Tax=Enterobacteriaceae TaxID=543 RepID=UPI001C8CA066|nr:MULTISPECIES: hypothetical protein [Enterobacteriaceae]MBX8657330.1 transcriptional regulator [Klebsiella michiganensis]MDO8235657.1 hypothetical protein [Citrobacter werkmanii]HBM3126404.1 hypothetical protein [Klebsiella michiganensis]HBM3132271.1 hypothetical protein [Klebsiella michiganensis]